MKDCYSKYEKTLKLNDKKSTQFKSGPKTLTDTSAKIHMSGNQHNTIKQLFTQLKIHLKKKIHRWQLKHMKSYFTSDVIIELQIETMRC